MLYPQSFAEVCFVSKSNYQAIFFVVCEVKVKVFVIATEKVFCPSCRTNFIEKDV